MIKLTLYEDAIPIGVIETENKKLAEDIFKAIESCLDIGNKNRLPYTLELKET